MKFTAVTRKAQGTGASRRLRRAEKLPGIVYGGKVAATPIELDHNEIFHALRNEKFHASILEMVLEASPNVSCFVLSKCIRTNHRFCTSISSVFPPMNRSA